MYKSNRGSASSSSRYNDNNSSNSKPGRFALNTRLLDDDEYKHDHNQIYNDDSKFARQLKKLLRDDEDDRKIQKILDLSSYLDQQENIKFVLKLSRASLNILLKILWDQQINEIRVYLMECISKIGYIMLADRDPNKYFEWTMSKVSMMSNDNRDQTKDNDIKILLLHALRQNFNHDAHFRYLKDNINRILTELKKALEAVDTPDLMIEITKTLMQVSSLFPDATLAIFQDVVDILIAWHLDCSQTSSVIEFISEILVELRPYWLKDMHFTLTLVYQFLEDIESYISDTNRRKEIERTEKMSALLKVFNTVIKSISCVGDTSYQPLRVILSVEHEEQLIGALVRVLGYASRVSESRLNELIYGPVNYCIQLYSDIFEEKIHELDNLILNFIINQNKMTNIWSYDVDSSFLQLLTKLLNYYISVNNIELFSQLMSSKGRLWNYRFSQNSQLIQEGLKFFKLLIVIKSVPIVQEVYKTILNDAQEAFELIIKCFNANEIDSRKAETSLLFDLCIFAELGNAKNNLICMYALSPSLFQLLTDKLSPCNWTLAESFPSIQYAILSTLYSHCSRHDNFIASSGLFSAKSTSSETVLLTNAPARDHFRTIVENLVQLIPHETTTFDISMLTLSWLLEIVDLVSIDYMNIFESALFSQLIDAVVNVAYSTEVEICLLANKILLRILQKFRKLNEKVLVRILDLCKYYTMSLDDELKNEYVKLFCYIPVNISACRVQNTSVLSEQDFSVFSQIARNNYAQSSEETVLGVNNFKAIMGYMLAGLSQGCDKLYSRTWLERLFYASQHREDKNSKQAGKDGISMKAVVDSNEGLLWFWALWECAQFCVQSRLKTPIGKAQDTFVAIENVIKGYFAQLQGYKSMLQGTGSIESAGGFDVNRLNGVASELSKVTILMHFIEYLEKLIYNAYEGTTVSCQPVQKAVKLFFRTNKSTCNEWFWRVRYFLVKICVKCKLYEIAVRHCYEYIEYAIQHNLTLTSDFDSIILALVESLTKLHAWQSLSGVHKWVSLLTKKNYDWILASSEEARGKLESANERFKQSLKSSLTVESSESMSPFQTQILKFQSDKIFDIYFQLHDWHEYLAWYDEYKSILSQQQQTGPEGNVESLKQQLDSRVDLNYIRSLCSFEAYDYDGAVAYGSDMLEPSLVCDTLTLWNVEEMESACLKEIFQSVVMGTQDLRLADVGLNVLNMDEMSAWNYERYIASQLYQLRKSDSQELPFIKSLKLDPNRHNAGHLNHLRLAILSKQSTTENLSFNDFRIGCAKLARKQQNTNLALRLAKEQLDTLYSKFLPNDNFQQQNDSFFNNLKHLASNSFIVNLTLKDQVIWLETELESSKLLYELNSNKLDSIEVLTNSIIRYAHKYLQINSQQSSFNQFQAAPVNALFTNPIVQSQLHLKSNKIDLLNERCGKSILALVSWLNNDADLVKQVHSGLQTYTQMNMGYNQSEYQIEAIAAHIHQLINLKNNQSIDQSKFSLVKDSTLNLVNNETFLGDLIDLSTVVNPKQAKAWYELANWCYKWGKKSADKIQLNFNSGAGNNSTDNSSNEYSVFFKDIPAHTTSDEKEFIVSIFSKGLSLVNMASVRDMESDEAMSKGELSRESFLAETRALLLENCQSLTAEYVDGLLELWKNIVNRIYYFYRIACRSYFTFLNLSEQNSENETGDKNISATIRIVKLLVKYSVELKEDLQSGLLTTPTQPWKGIIPQLFCRLNHPEAYVRQSLSDLLCRIARDLPHLIVYPAVVGSQDGPTRIENMHKQTDTALLAQMDEQLEMEDEDIVDDGENQQGAEQEAMNRAGSGDSEDEAEDEEEIVKEEKQVELKNSYRYLLDTLTGVSPRMIEEVKLFVHELRRITLLREELWIGTLNQIHSDINKRMDQLSNEINKVTNNQSLTELEKTSIIRDKYEILLQPVVSVLEHVHDITTNLPAETPNEEHFQQEFGQKITDALNQLKNAENAFKPYNGWALFKQLHQLLYQRSQRKQTTSLLMDQISPKLSALKASLLPLPGKDGQFCTIHSISNSIVVLPTKTKPKKLLFVGSNGRRYPYLFKGLEDLHLDERIMQLLSIVNTMFVKVNKSELPNYHALHYSVTPLGPRSGLISWVEGSTPLFALYKKWQQREAIYQATKQQQPQTPSILRPNDLFYSKLNPILKEKGLTSLIGAKAFTENRQDCPATVLRQVLEELIKDTPNDLLSKELWCSSATPGTWWKSVQFYARSTAVMSIIGYVIGLGDRHLDNVLVNLNTGEVAHIDYNVCFEKGQNLRVPERVPFRMTQNLEHALGSTGVEGLFRLSCEHVMATLRRGRETLLTLLEAFVYDPLLDWTSNDTGIIASFYGGGQQSSRTKPLSSRTKESRKSVERKMTARLLAIRLVENRALAEKNQEHLMQLIGKLESKVSVLCESLDKREDKEDNIRLYGQAKIYLDESLTLHGESGKGGKGSTNQHPVFSLHERYDAYSRHEQSLSRCNASNTELQTKLARTKEQNEKSFKFIVSSQQTLSALQYNESDITDRPQHLLKSLASLELVDCKKNTLETAMEQLNLEDQHTVACLGHNQLKEPYRVTQDFFQSISQLNLISPTMSMSNELTSVQSQRLALLEASFSCLTENSGIYRWLPKSYSFVDAKLNQILGFCQRVAGCLRTSARQQQQAEFLQICNEYCQSFNPKFELCQFKNQRDMGTTHLSLDQIKLNTIEIKNHKVSSLIFEANSLQDKSSALLLRKAAMTPDESEGNQLFTRHDLIENNFLSYLENELNSAPTENLAGTNFQLFEAFSYLLDQYLNENLRKWMMMENATVEAKEHLFTMTSIDGDWFLEEMLSLMFNCSHLSQLIRNVYLRHGCLSDPLAKSLEMFETLPLVFSNLKSLLFVYETELMETLAQVAMHDVVDVNAVLQKFEVADINELFEILNREDFSIEDFESNVDYISKLNRIKMNYNQLLLNKDTACWVVLVELEKLFSRVECEFEKLIKSIKVLYAEEQFKMATNQSIFSLTPSLICLLDDRVLSFYKNIFFVKKTNTIYNIINGCTQYNEFCFGSSDSANSSINQVQMPFKIFISEFIVQMMVGIPTVLLGNIINKLKEDKDERFKTEFMAQNPQLSDEPSEQLAFLLSQSMLNSHMNENYYAFINHFLAEYDHTWTSIDLHKRIDSIISINQAYISLNQKKFNALNWYYDYLSEDQSEQSTRAVLVNELEQLCANLASNNGQCNELLEKLNASEQQILKRIEWASGANPSLTETVREFEAQRKQRNNYFMVENKLLKRLEIILESWFNLEQIRNDTSAIYASVLKQFEKILSTVEEEGFLDTEQTIPSITDTELSLMNFKDFSEKRPLTNTTIQEYYRLLYEELAVMKRNKQKEEKDCSTKVEELLVSLNDFKATLNQHNKVMSDIKPLLKTMNKFGENARLQSYTKVYYEFSDNCQLLVRYLGSDEMLQTRPREIQCKLDSLKGLVLRIYTDLNGLNCESTEWAEIVSAVQEDKSALLRVSSKTGKAVQECNSYAVSVWKRVYQKLEGRDIDPEIVCSSQDQVDYVIKQAVDLNNLSQLYEGWTSWV